MNWYQAKKAAEDNGGYLATVTSQEEWQKVLAAYDGTSYCLLGANDADVEGEWRWVTGPEPEKGTQFWQGADPASGGHAVNGMFTAWVPGWTPSAETPGVDFMQMHPIWGGRWDDDVVLESYYDAYMLETGDEPLDIKKGPQSFDVGDPISPQGNFYISVTDIKCPARGPGFEMARIYNSVDTNAGPLGVGWHFNYLTRVETNGAGVVLVRQDAKRETYALTNGTYVIQGDVWSGDLWRTAEGWRFRDKANSSWLYGAEGRLFSVRDRNGNALALAWSTEGLLTNVADSVGRDVVFRYDGAGLLTNVADWAGRGVAYGYTNVGGRACLGTVRDVRGFTTVYGYDINSTLLVVSDARGNKTVENVYDAQRRVVSQTDALTNLTEIAY